MRAAITMVLALQLVQARAQTDSTAFSYILYSVKGYVLLTNGDRVIVEGITVDKYNRVVLFSPGVNIINNTFTHKGDVRTMQKQIVSSSEIKLIKVKRQSFASGAAVGAVSGYGLGYLGGFATYDYDFTYLEDENDDRRKTRGVVFGLGVAIPTALVGGFIGGLFIKKKFRIDGNLDRMKNILHRVAQ